MEALNIDFEVPYHLITHYYVSGSIALILNLLVVYLILFHSGKLDTFRFYLLAFQIICIITDLNLTVFMQPIGLFPIRAGYCNGIASRFLNWSSHVLLLYPKFIAKFRALREFQYYTLNNWLIIFFVLTILGTAKAAVIVSILVIRMYKTLNENASQMSTNTLAKHKTALKSLIMQFLTTPISFLPALVILLTILIPTEYSQKISYWSLMVGTTHSILNSIVVIITYAEFRKALMFWRRNTKMVATLVPPVKPSGG